MRLPMGLDILYCRWRQDFRTKTATETKPADAFNLKRSSLVEAAYLSLRSEDGCQRPSDEVNDDGLGQKR